MRTLMLLALAALAGGLFFTNPSDEAQRRAIAEAAVTKAAGGSDLAGKIAGNWASALDVMPLKYKNYYLFSTVTLNDKTKSIGVMNKVWVLD